MIDIIDLLNLRSWRDFVDGPNVCAAGRRPDVAPFAYEIVVFKPMNPEILQKLQAFGNGAAPQLIRDLYSMCNGLRIGATRFSVYGVIGEIERSPDELQSRSPLDINVPNLYGRPAGWPDDVLIVGCSFEQNGDRDDDKFLHALTPEGKIVVCSEVNFNTPYRAYSSVEKWLQKEVRRALNDATGF